MRTPLTSMRVTLKPPMTTFSNQKSAMTMNTGHPQNQHAIRDDRSAGDGQHRIHAVARAVSARDVHQCVQSTQPSHAVSRITAPKAIRYQPKTVKSCVEM